MTECVKQTRGNPIFEFYFLLYTILEKNKKKNTKLLLQWSYKSN